MIRGKRIAIVQAGVVGALALGAVLQAGGLGTAYTLADESAAARNARAFPALAGEPNKLRPFPQYAEVLDRPLFNESRLPEVEETAAPANAAPTAGELNATLTGVIIAGDARLAIITNAANGEGQRVRVGQPLEGELAGWQLVELSPRLAVFEGSGSGRKELELTVDTKGAAAPPPPPPRAPPPQQQAQAGQPQVAGQQPAAAPVAATPGAQPAPGQPASADEIRRRIEERRKQLREEAQRMLQEQNDNPNQ